MAWMPSSEHVQCACSAIIIAVLALILTPTQPLSTHPTARPEPSSRYLHLHTEVLVDRPLFRPHHRRQPQPCTEFQPSIILSPPSSPSPWPHIHMHTSHPHTHPYKVLATRARTLTCTNTDRYTLTRTLSHTHQINHPHSHAHVRSRSRSRSHAHAHSDAHAHAHAPARLVLGIGGGKEGGGDTRR